MSNKVSVFVLSDVGSKREQNQDNYFAFGRINDTSALHDEVNNEFLYDNPEIIAVFDGMGGEHDGEKASLAAAQEVEALKSSLNKLNEIEHSLLLAALQVYYDDFKEQLEENTACAGNEVCGTTCAMAVLFSRSFIPIWIGDSRIYLIRNGKLLQISKDHTFAQERIDSGELDENEARFTPAWHMLTKYMGGETADFSVGEKIDIFDGDRIVLCSDGISDMYDNSKLTELLSGDVNEISEKLQIEIRDKADDNCTILIADYIYDEEYSFERALKGVKETSEKFFKTIKDKCLSDIS